MLPFSNSPVFAEVEDCHKVRASTVSQPRVKINELRCS